MSLGFGIAALLIALTSIGYVLVLSARRPLMAPSDLWNISISLAVRNLPITGPLFVAEFTATALLLLLDPVLALIGVPILLLQCLRLTARLGVRRVGEVLRSPVSPFCCRRNMRPLTRPGTGTSLSALRDQRPAATSDLPWFVAQTLAARARSTMFGRSSDWHSTWATSARPRRDRPPAWAVTSQVAIAIVLRDSRVTLLPSSVSAGWHSPRRDSLHQAASNTAKRSSRRSTPIGATPSCRRPPRRTAQQAQHEVSRHVDALANWRSK